MFSTAQNTKIETKPIADPKSTWKINIRLPWTVFQILLMSAVICIWKSLLGNEIKQDLKTYKYHNVNQDHSKRNYKVVLGTYNLATQTSVCLLRAVEF